MCWISNCLRDSPCRETVISLSLFLFNPFGNEIKREVLFMDKKYYVYMHNNKVNNKKYIGITCREKPEYRWGKNGNSYRGQVFKTAIDKYGWNNFDHLILFEGLSAEEAYEKEKELIKKYKSNQKEYGYNLSVGGEHGSTGYLNNSMSIHVYQYDLNGNFISEYPSLSEAERVTGVPNNSISACCKGKHLYTYDFSMVIFKS